MIPFRKQKKSAVAATALPAARRGAHTARRGAPALATSEPTAARHGIEVSALELVALRGALAPLSAGPLGRVRSLQSGPWRSAFRGRGIEFDETRIYQAGDDVRTIDWRVTARTGRVHTKLFHEERERPVLLLLDQRAAMRFGTRSAFKSVAAARAAAALAWAARDGGDRVGAAVFGMEGREELPPQRTQHALLALLGRIARATQTAISPAYGGAERRGRGTPGGGDVMLSASAGGGGAERGSAHRDGALDAKGAGTSATGVPTSGALDAKAARPDATEAPSSARPGAAAPPTRPAVPSLRDELERLTRVARPGTLVFVISDFHDLDEATATALTRLGRAAEVCCILIYDPIERALPGAGRLRVTDGRELRVLPTDDAAWRRHYAEGFQTRRERLHRVCARTRGILLELRTDDDLARALRADRFTRARTRKPSTSPREGAA